MVIGRFNLMSRSGLEPTVGVGTCANEVLTNFTIKEIYALRNSNWITVFTKFVIKSIYDLRKNNWIQLLFRKE